MGWRDRFEFGLDVGAAAVLGAAASFCATLLGAGVAGAVLGGAVFPLAFVALRTVPDGRALPLAPFAPQALEFAAEPDLLLLTERVGDELLLDDRLAPAAEDSRVVRLFGDHRIPTAGELHANIERHLASRQAVPDATQALSDALAELRRNLR